MRFFYVGGGLTASLSAPDGDSLAEWITRTAPGDTLNLAEDGTYTLAGGAAGFSGIPSGSISSPTTVRGNGATVTGGQTGILLVNKSYVSFYDLHIVDQTETSLNTSIVSNIVFEDCTFGFDSNQPGYIDVTKLFSMSDSRFTRCTAWRGPSSVAPTQTIDGFELWPRDGVAANVIFEDCIAYGFDMATSGHGFEVYRDTLGDYETGVEFIRCTAHHCIVGFSVESGGVAGTSHEVTAEDCVTHDNDTDYAVDGDASFVVSGASEGATESGGVTFN